MRQPSDKPRQASKSIDYVNVTIRQIMYDFFLCLEDARIALHLLLGRTGVAERCLGERASVACGGARVPARAPVPVDRAHERLQSGRARSGGALARPDPRSGRTPGLHPSPAADRQT